MGPVVTDCCVLDTSIVVAIAIGHAESHSLLALMGRMSRKAIGAPSLVEAAMVINDRLAGRNAEAWIEAFLHDLQIETIPFGLEHYRLSADAFRRFGKGHHPARLNFGDCLAYSGAKLLDWPLLFIGTDFTLTDLRPAIAEIPR
jgi:ribonuclease VapC